MVFCHPTLRTMSFNVHRSETFPEIQRKLKETKQKCTTVREHMFRFGYAYRNSFIYLCVPLDAPLDGLTCDDKVLQVSVWLVCSSDRRST